MLRIGYFFLQKNYNCRPLLSLGSTHSVIRFPDLLSDFGGITFTVCSRYFPDIFPIPVIIYCVCVYVVSFSSIRPAHLVARHALQLHFFPPSHPYILSSFSFLLCILWYIHSNSWPEVPFLFSLGCGLIFIFQFDLLFMIIFEPLFIVDI